MSNSNIDNMSSSEENDDESEDPYDSVEYLSHSDRDDVSDSDDKISLSSEVRVDSFEEYYSTLADTYETLADTT